MAFGIGKAFKKAFKKAGGTILGAALAPFTGGASLVMGIGYDVQKYQAEQQQEIANAQIASAEKIASMQNHVVQAAATPTSTTQDAEIAEQNTATAKKWAFSFAKTQRMGSVARRNTLG